MNKTINRTIQRASKGASENVISTNKAIKRISTNQAIKPAGKTANLKSGRFTSTVTDIQGATNRDLSRMRMHDAKINSSSKQAQYYKNKDLAKQQLQQQQQQLRNKRIKTGVAVGAAGLYAGSDIVDRYRNGGTVNRNNEGERDIVGIPFF